eukprot:4453535-Ditylum_brightwellii.AAC.1
MVGSIWMPPSSFVGRDGRLYLDALDLRWEYPLMIWNMAPLLDCQRWYSILQTNWTMKTK